jgi:hypothetical protein
MECIGGKDIATGATDAKVTPRVPWRKRCVRCVVVWWQKARWHFGGYRSRLQRSDYVSSVTQGFTLGWYSVAPSALTAAIALFVAWPAESLRWVEKHGTRRVA